MKYILGFLLLISVQLFAQKKDTVIHAQRQDIVRRYRVSYIVIGDTLTHKCCGALDSTDYPVIILSEQAFEKLKKHRS